VTSIQLVVQKSVEHKLRTGLRLRRRWTCLVLLFQDVWWALLCVCAS